MRHTKSGKLIPSVDRCPACGHNVTAAGSDYINAKMAAKTLSGNDIVKLTGFSITCAACMFEWTEPYSKKIEITKIVLEALDRNVVESLR